MDDQLHALREWAARTGREVVAVLRDDGVSASRYAGKRKTRPDWQKAMELIVTGQIDELGVWEISRTTRDRAVWAALSTACIEHGVALVVDGRVHDPADPDDGFMLDLSFITGVRESAIISKRTKRAVDSRAAAGRPHGSLPYGYRRVLDPVTGRALAREPHPEQAPIVQEIVRRLLAREPADAIAADLNARGVPTKTGKAWRGGNLSKLALSPTYAGKRVHDRKVLPDVKASWPPLISETDHARLVALFADPARDKFRNSTVVRHLGTGIYRCGRPGCDGRMRVVVESGKPNRYDCRSCHRVSRHQEPTDLLVEETLIARLSRPDALAALNPDTDEGVRAALAKAEEIEARLEEARVAWLGDALTLAEYTSYKDRWAPELAAAQRLARPPGLPTAVLELAGPDARERWCAATTTQRRTVLDALLVVTILPVGRGGRRFDPMSIDITPA